MRKLTALITALVLLNGCFTSHQTRRMVQQPQLSATDLTFATGGGKVARAKEIVEVELHDGSVLEFDGAPALDDDLVLRGQVVVSREDDRVTTSAASIPWSQVESVAVRQRETKLDTMNTLLAIAIPVGMVAVLYAAFSSSSGAGSGGGCGYGLFGGWSCD